MEIKFAIYLGALWNENALLYYYSTEIIADQDTDYGGTGVHRRTRQQHNPSEIKHSNKRRAFIIPDSNF